MKIKPTDQVNPPTNLGAMPALSGFTQLNVSGTRFITEDSGKGFLIGDTSGTGGQQVHGVYKAHGLSAPYRTVLLCLANGKSVNYYFPIFGFRDSASGKLMLLSPNINTGAWESSTWNSATLRAGVATASGSGNAPPANRVLYGETYYAIRDDGTNIYLETSATGHKDDWHTVHTFAKSGAFLTNFDQIFFGMFQETASGFKWTTSWRMYATAGLTRGY